MGVGDEDDIRGLGLFHTEWIDMDLDALGLNAQRSLDAQSQPAGSCNRTFLHGYTRRRKFYKGNRSILLGDQMKRGQVSTEYLVILAVVLVIALVVVFLVSQGTDVGSGVTETQSKNYWGVQSPLSIVGYGVTASTMTMDVTNRDAEEITLTSVDVDGTERFSTSTTFAPGETRTLNMTLGAACTTDTRFSYDIDFTYNRGGISALLQGGERDLIGTCS